jgi:tetratricopeptide (TPR) repeat protein
MGAPGVRQRLIALASDGDQPAIARASALDRIDRIADQASFEALRALLHDRDPLVRRSAASVYRSLPLELRGDLVALLDDPVRDVRLEAARLVAEVPPSALQPKERKKREQGIAQYLESQRSNAGRPESHHNIGDLHISLGQYADAERELKEALRIDPDFVPAAVTLADLYRGLGRDAEGEPVLRAMIAEQPAAAAARLALGLWLVRSGRRDEALIEFEQAAELGPQDPQFAYVYAVALSDLGQQEEAVEVLEAALRRHPYHRGILFALASYERDAGNIVPAIEYATRLVELEPDDPTLRQFLSELRL